MRRYADGEAEMMQKKKRKEEFLIDTMGTRSRDLIPHHGRKEIPRDIGKG